MTEKLTGRLKQNNAGKNLGDDMWNKNGELASENMLRYELIDLLLLKGFTTFFLIAAYCQILFW